MSALIKHGIYKIKWSLFTFLNYIGTLPCCLVFYGTVYSQGNVFSAQIITDLNFSQIEGDLMAGYHRIGYGAGVGVGYVFTPRWMGHLEMIYRNVGSKDSPFSDLRRSVHIHQAQLPVYISYRTWWDNGLSRFHFDGGFQYSRNFRSKINFPKFEENIGLLREDDLSFLIGFGLWFNSHHGIQTRYIRSLTPILNIPEKDVLWKIYYISLQYLYRI